MFVARCETRGSRVLLGLDAIRAIRRLPAGTIIEFECTCGVMSTELVEVKTCR